MPRIWHFTLGMALYTLYTFTLHLSIKQHFKQDTVPVHCGTAGNRVMTEQQISVHSSPQCSTSSMYHPQLTYHEVNANRNAYMLT